MKLRAGVGVIPGVADTSLWIRKQHIRETNRYQSDLTDEEWAVIKPHLPVTKSTGRPRAWSMINGIFYVMRSGCPWRLLPSDLPPWSTVHRWFAKFRGRLLREDKLRGSRRIGLILCKKLRTARHSRVCLGH